MEKADLKDFQVVVLKNGLRGVVLLKYKENHLPVGLREEFGVRTTEFVILNEGCVFLASEYKDNLKHRKRRDLDIMEVYGDGAINPLSELLKIDKLKCVYKRKEKNLKKFLKTGCVASTRDGNNYLVIKDCDTENYGKQEFCLIKHGGFLCGDDYDKNLCHNALSKGDIVKIYGEGYINSGSANIDTTYMDVIWERKDD